MRMSVNASQAFLPALEGDESIFSVPASCGELAQGYLDGRDYLISAPIDLYASVRVKLTHSGRIEVIAQKNYNKVARAVEMMIRKSRFPYCGAEIRVDSPIPRGKGMASSTSEIAAAIYATAEVLGEAVTGDDVSGILIEVDRSTDALYYSDVVRVDHLQGKVLESLGRPPSLAFIVVDQGGEVSTMDFDRDKARCIAMENEALQRHALKLIQQGFVRRRPHLVASGATISAMINQEILHKPMLREILQILPEVGALGVNCAHTGTVLGIMFDPEEVCADKILKRTQALLGVDNVMGLFRLQSGSARGLPI